jgi:cell wall-associated NlpC family hydrolase
MPGLAAFLALIALAVMGPSSAPVPVAAPAAASSHHAARTNNLAGAAFGGRPALAASLAPAKSFSVPVAAQLAAHSSAVARLGKLRVADLFVIAPTALPAGLAARIRRLSGVTADESLDAARLQVDGKYAAVLGVDPSTFRSYAARPTAASDKLWQSVAAGDMVVSYTMGRLDRLPLGGKVSVAGVKPEKLTVGGFATVGITGTDAVVSEAVARSLGFPAGNAIVVSAPHATISKLTGQINRLLPKGAVVQPLVSQVNVSGTTGSAGVVRITRITTVPTTRVIDGYPTLTSGQLTTMLRAALSRVGKPYVWGGDGPGVFDCSGLVQWSFAQAGIVMPRVAADQAITGPSVPLADAEPGDLLFYHFDPTDPDYISHVAIYLGNGMMEQAPMPGEDVQVVPAYTGSGFAGLVRVDPQIAAQVAGSI